MGYHEVKWPATNFGGDSHQFLWHMGSGAILHNWLKTRRDAGLVQHLQLWQVDVHGIWSPTTVHRARALEDYWHLIYVQWHCEYPMPDRIHVHWGIICPSLPKLSIWKWRCHLHEEIQLAEQGHKGAGSHQHGSRNSQAQVVLYHMPQTIFPHKLRHGHHCEEVQCETRLHTPECTSFPHLKVECCIVQNHFFRKQRHSHHFGEALYDRYLQTPGCMSFPHLKVECCTVPNSSLHKQWHSRHFGEELYGRCQRKPGCMSFPPSR